MRKSLRIPDPDDESRAAACSIDQLHLSSDRNPSTNRDHQAVASPLNRSYHLPMPEQPRVGASARLRAAQVVVAVLVGLGTAGFYSWLSREWPETPSWVYLLIWTTSAAAIILSLTWGWLKVGLRRCRPVLTSLAKLGSELQIEFLGIALAPRPKVLEPERRVQIRVNVDKSQLTQLNSEWYLWLFLVIAVKQSEPAHIGSASLSWEDGEERPPADLEDRALVFPQHRPVLPVDASGQPEKGYLCFKCGSLAEYAGKSIFDGVFRLRIKFIDEPEFEYRCRALRWPEGTPGAVTALQYDVEAV